MLKSFADYAVDIAKRIQGVVYVLKSGISWLGCVLPSTGSFRVTASVKLPLLSSRLEEEQGKLPSLTRPCHTQSGDHATPLI